MSRLGQAAKLRQRESKLGSDVEIEPEKKPGKTKNLSYKKGVKSNPSVPTRFDGVERSLLTETLENLEENYTNLTRSDVIRAAVRLLEVTNKKNIEKAIDSVKMGKAL